MAIHLCVRPGKNIFLQLRCDLTQGVDAVRLRTHYAFLRREGPLCLAADAGKALLCRLTGTAQRAALWVAAYGKKGFLPPQTPPSSPKPAIRARIIENEIPHVIKISIYSAVSYKNISVRTYCLIMSPDPKQFPDYILASAQTSSVTVTTDLRTAHSAEQRLLLFCFAA